MKIIYSRKQAQAVTEHVNSKCPWLSMPLSFKGVCENVLDAFEDSDKTVFNGIVYTFVPYGDFDLYCIISVVPEFFENVQDGVPFEIEITEDSHARKIQNDANKFEEEMKQLGMTVMGFDSIEEFADHLLDEEESKIQKEDEVKENTNKKTLH